jgi:hypothetical protein
MTAWVSVGIATVALLYAIVSNRVERRDRKHQFELVERQAALAEQAHGEQRRSYLSVEQRGKSGGETFDRHEFRVTNAGPSRARHLSLRVDRPGGGTVAGPAKVDPHVLDAGAVTMASLDVPRAERLNDLVVVVEWVDTEQQGEWMEHHKPKERIVEPLEPLTGQP